LTFVEVTATQSSDIFLRHSVYQISFAFSDLILLIFIEILVWRWCR